MRISDWSSDVCSSDLHRSDVLRRGRTHVPLLCRDGRCHARRQRRTYRLGASGRCGGRCESLRRPDRKSVVEGKSVSVRVDPGGSRIIKKKNTTQEKTSV